jgi:hypothetical protein
MPTRHWSGAFSPLDCSRNVTALNLYTAPMDRSVPDVDNILQILDVHGADRTDCIRLLDPRTGPDPARVGTAVDICRSLIGSFPDLLPRFDGGAPVALATELLLVTDAMTWQNEHRIDPAVTRETFADFGRQLAIGRRNTGDFGMDDPRWPLAYLLGGLFQLGRLQFHLRRYDRIPGVIDAGDWVLNMHVPATGPLHADAVSDSIRRARDFFADTFPDKPARIIVCNSWLLDPHLIAHLPGSNIASFARRFTLHAGPTDDPAAALHFVFGTKDLTHLDRLPRDTSLQRLVLDRIAAGGTWQRASGYLMFG